MANLTAADMMARSEPTLSSDADIYSAMQQLLRKKIHGCTGRR